ncbi:hypothetical protein [Streptomyces sp. B15]|nr:hypothetical protein [Streptomyces sp. B15]MBQ1122463.1 hypothetical protein [Streptomyces sp. B15]
MSKKSHPGDGGGHGLGSKGFTFGEALRGGKGFMRRVRQLTGISVTK